MSRPPSLYDDVKPMAAGGLTPEMRGLATPGDFTVRRRLPTPPTTENRVNPKMSLQQFRSRLLEGNPVLLVLAEGLCEEH